MGVLPKCVHSIELILHKILFDISKYGSALRERSLLPFTWYLFNFEQFFFSLEYTDWF